MKKRILSILLAALMIISVLPAYALADNGVLSSPAAEATPVTDNGITATKSAEWVDGGKDGIAKVTIEVRGTAGTTSVETAPTDIVLVVDASASMEKSSKLTNAKTAAKGFVDKFLAEGSSNVKIAVVSYSKEANNVSNGLQTSADTLKTAIDNIKADGGTNIQAGIHMAQEILDDDKTQNVKKIMIVLSDGEPTYSYRFDAQCDYVNCDSYFGDVHHGGHYANFAFAPNYKKVIGEGDDYRLSYNVKITKAICTKDNDPLHLGLVLGVGHEDNYVYTGGTGDAAFSNRSGTNNGVATIWEASQAKTAGTEIYAIGYGLDNNQNGTNTMKGIATDDTTHYYASGVEANDIQTVFNTISTQITNYCAYEPKVTDVIGNDFELATGEGYTLPEGVTYDASSKTLTWNVGDHLDENVKTLTFYVKYENVDDPADPSANDGKLDTNKEAKLTYKTEKEGTEEKTLNIDLANSKVLNLAKKVFYDDNVADADLLKPEHADKFYWPGKTVTVADAPNERNGYTFEGWETSDAAISEGKFTMPSKDVTLTAKWAEKQVQKYKVTYQYPDTKPDSATPPTDSNEYAVDEVYTLQTVTALEGWTFDGWYRSYNTTTNEFTNKVTSSTENKMVAGGVTLYGKWTAPAEMFTVSYKFVSADDTGLPFEVTALKPSSKQVTKDTTETPATFADVSVTGGTWKFNGWTPASHTITSNFEFTGTWEFKKTELPPEKTYDVRLTISKTVDNVHGTAPAETYNFVVYYKDAAGNPVYLRDASNPLTISLDAGEDSKEKDFTIEMTQTQLDSWPKTEVHFGEDESVELQLVYVEEIDGGTKHMTYADKPIRGYLDGIAITSARSTMKYWLMPIDNFRVFSFTNVYNKTTGRDVTPAKVSPQLNRDDHVAYIMGYPDGNVRPEGEITRAEACTIFFRLLTKESRDYYFSRTNDYTDVSRTDWFNNAISTLSNAGIVTGYADGTFRPDQPITRGEMAKIIANFARLGGATKSFTDLSGHWAKSYVELAAGNGWIAGYPDGTFRPDQKITRAETVTMINRVLERVPAKESRLLSRSIMLTFPDNKPGEWYYIAVQEASNSHTYQRSAYETAGDEMWLRLIENVDWTKLEK